ncbi:MAG: hypothetical protein KME47_09690 [Nodosilinea sp. WJT8-NPBG4]|jgi:hypothetical protein|nr:hypothetical protein [Nodosilinea sp. WJT8-NPBG4]
MPIVAPNKTVFFAWTGAQTNLTGSVFNVGGAIIHAVDTVDQSLWLSWKAGRSATLNSLLTLETNRCYRLQTGTVAIDVPSASSISFGNTVNQPFLLEGTNLGNLQLKLTWQAPSSTIVRYYELQIAPNADNYTGNPIKLASNLLTYTSTVSTEGFYKARIRARTDLNISAWADIAGAIEVTIVEPTPPEPPAITFLSGRPSDSGLINFQTNGGVPNDPASAQTNSDVWNLLCQTQPGSNRSIIFPAGTWYFNDTIRTVNPSNNNWFARWTVQGDSRETTTLKLVDNAIGFNDPGNPKAFMILGGSENQSTTVNPTGSGNTAFGMRCMDMVIDTGNNPGAVALDFTSHNWGCIERVTVTGNGYVGIHGNRSDGPHLNKDITINGFQYGFRIRQAFYSLTYVNLILTNQTVAGFYLEDNMVSIENLVSTNQVPAILAPALTVSGGTNTGSIILIGGTLNGGSASTSAIVGVSVSLYLRNVTSSGYGSTVDLGNGRTIPGTIDEYSSSVYRAFNSPPGSLKLPIQSSPPVFNSTNLDDWANVVTYGAQPTSVFLTDPLDSITGLNAAAASGRPILYFQRASYATSDTWVIPPSVKRIVGNQVTLTTKGTLWSANSKPIIRTTGDTTDPLTLDALDLSARASAATNFTQISILHDSPRPLVIKNCRLGSYIAITNTAIAGPIFIDDVLCSPASFESAVYPLQVKPGGKYFARSLNIEYTNMILNDGGELWSLGFKTEGGWEAVRTINGGKTEMLGTFLYPIEDFTTTEVAARNIEAGFIIVDSDFSAVFSLAGSSTTRLYTNVLSETRTDTKRILPRSYFNSRGLGVRCSALSAYPYVGTEPTTDPLVEDLKYINSASKGVVVEEDYQALDTYLKALETDGIRSKVFQLFPLIGGNLETAMKALDYRPGTFAILSEMSNYNIPESGYSRKNGVQGVASELRALAARLSLSSQAANDVGLHVWTSQIETASGVRTLMGGMNSSSDQHTVIGRLNTSTTDAGSLGGNAFTANNTARANTTLTGMLSVVNSGTRNSQFYHNGLPVGTASSATLTSSLASGIWLLATFRSGQSVLTPNYSTNRNLQWGAVTKGLTSSEMIQFYSRTETFIRSIQRIAVQIKPPYAALASSLDMQPPTLIITPSIYSNQITADFSASLASTGTAPLSADMLALDNFVSTMKSNGLWSRVWALMPLMGENQAHAMRRILRSPTDLTESVGVMTQSDTAGYTKVGGMQGNGSRSINTGINPSSRVTPTNAALHAWTSQTESLAGTRWLMGYWDSVATQYTGIAYNGTRETGRIGGSSTAGAVGPTSSVGLLSVMAGASRQAQYYVNGSPAGTLGTAATGAIENGMYLLSGFKRGSTAEGHTNRNIGFSAITEAYTNDEMLTFNSIVYQLLIALGRSN